MKWTEGKIGRVFVLRLEDKDDILSTIEKFAEEQKIRIGHVVMIGCIGEGNIITGPYDGNANPPEPIKLPLDGVHETVATGIIAPTNNGKPLLHLHGALGRAGKTTTGCLREGVSTWVVGEVIIYEINDVDDVQRLYDKETGFTLLNVK